MYPGCLSPEIRVSGGGSGKLVGVIVANPLTVMSDEEPGIVIRWETFKVECCCLDILLRGGLSGLSPSPSFCAVSCDESRIAMVSV